MYIRLLLILSYVIETLANQACAELQRKHD
jgi:hypothetical protein